MMGKQAWQFVVAQFALEDARSVPKCTGRNGRYKTFLPRWDWVLERPPSFWTGSRLRNLAF